MNRRKMIRLEANRLKQRIEETKMFSECSVASKKRSYWVQFKICDYSYAFPVTLATCKKTYEEVTNDFDTFVAQCIMHASQMRALQITLEKNTKKVE